MVIRAWSGQKSDRIKLLLFDAHGEMIWQADGTPMRIKGAKGPVTPWGPNPTDSGVVLTIPNGEMDSCVAEMPLVPHAAIGLACPVTDRCPTGDA